MEITGKLVQTLAPITGSGANGEWSKQEFVIETASQYPKKVCMVMWGDKAEALKEFSVGDTITCHIDVESREYNGRWFSDIKAWKVEKGEGEPQAAAPTQGVSTDESQGLPF